MTSEVTTDPANESEEISFYRHTRKKEWGLALILWERDGKRGYKFEDGKERIIAEPYYKLLNRTDEEPTSDSVLIAAIARMQGGDSDDKLDAMTFDEQLAVFLAQYPGAFGSDAWVKGYRGKEGKRRLKRHRVPAILEAQERLSKSEMDRYLEQGAHKELQETLVEVLGATDLVTKAQLEPYRKGVGGEAFTRALHAMLWGTEDMGKRFSGLAKAMAMLWPRVPWTVITAPLALVHPKEHTCVKPSVFTKQADCTSKPIRPTKLPTARVYRGYLEMVKELRDALSDAGAPPHDLLDIYDLIWITQRPAASEHLARVRAEDVLGRSTPLVIVPDAPPADEDAEATAEADADPAKPATADAAPAKEADDDDDDDDDETTTNDDDDDANDDDN